MNLFISNLDKSMNSTASSVLRTVLCFGKVLLCKVPALSSLHLNSVCLMDNLKSIISSGWSKFCVDRNFNCGQHLSRRPCSSWQECLSRCPCSSWGQHLSHCPSSRFQPLTSFQLWTVLLILLVDLVPAYKIFPVATSIPPGGQPSEEVPATHYADDAPSILSQFKCSRTCIQQ